jgi:hypothetical protein
MFQRFQRDFRPSSGCSLKPRYALIIMFLLAWASPAVRADFLYGVLSNGGIGFDPVVSQSWSTGGFQAVTLYASPLLGGSTSYPAGSAGGTVTDGAEASFSTDGNGGLHGFASADASADTPLGVSGLGSAGGGFFGEWTDTVFVVGLPVGTPVELRLTDSLVSFTSFSGSDSEGDVLAEASLADVTTGLNAGTDQSNVDAPGYVPVNGLQTQSVILQTVVGDPLQLTVELSGSALATIAGNGGLQTATGLADASDTENASISVLTQGASLTTASGIDYSALATVPEPHGLWLLALACTGLLAATRRKVKLSGNNPARD